MVCAQVMQLAENVKMQKSFWGGTYNHIDDESMDDIMLFAMRSLSLGGFDIQGTTEVCRLPYRITTGFEIDQLGKMREWLNG